LITVPIIEKIIPIIIAIPGIPITKDSPGLGKAPAVNNVTTVKTITPYTKIESFLKNGKAKKKMAKGILKY